MTEGMGTCQKHNRPFKLTEGCPDCLAEKGSLVNDQDPTPGQEDLFTIQAPSGGATVNQEEGTITVEVDSSQEVKPVMSQVRHGDNLAMIRIKPDLDEGVVKLYEESCRLLEFAQARDIRSDADVKLANDDLVIIANLKKAIEDKRKGYTGPINDHLKAVNEAFKEFSAPLVEADRVNRNAILAYRQLVEARRQEEERINRMRIEAAQAEAKLNQGEITESVDLVQQTAPPARVVRTGMGTQAYPKTWKWEVVDIDQVPRMYLVPDAPKIQKIIAAGGSIPGIRSWQEETIRVTGKGG